MPPGVPTPGGLRGAVAGSSEAAAGTDMFGLGITKNVNIYGVEARYNYLNQAESSKSRVVPRSCTSATASVYDASRHTAHRQYRHSTHRADVSRSSTPRYPRSGAPWPSRPNPELGTRSTSGLGGA